MRLSKPIAAVIILAAMLFSCCVDDDAPVPFYFAPLSDNSVVVMETTMGDISIELYARESPITVSNFLRYVRENYYDSLIFHRVVPNFIIQGGQYDVHLQEKPAHDPIICEADNGLSNRRGTIAMARTTEINSAASQFFINLKDNPHLDHSAIEFGYAVFGEVIAGMSVVDSIGAVETTSMNGLNDVPVEPVIILRIHIKI